MAKKKTVKTTEAAKSPPPVLHKNLVSLLPGQSIDLAGHTLQVETIGTYSGSELQPGQRLPLVRLKVTGPELPVVNGGEMPELSVVPLG